MRRVVLFIFLLAWMRGATGAATGVEMEACRLTPEAKKELKLTATQEPKVNKVFSELAPVRGQIDKAIKEVGELRRTGTDEATLANHRKDLIALETRCRDRLHQLLKPILTDEQYEKVLEMEETHRKIVREREAAQRQALR